MDHTPKCWYMNQRPQAAGHLLRAPCGSLCRNCWKLNAPGLDEYLLRRGVMNVKRLLEETPHRLQERSEERAIWGKKSLQPQYWIIDRVGLLNVPWLPWILRYSLAATLTSAGEVECLMFKWLPKIRQMLISCLTWQIEMTTWLLQIDF